MIDMRDMVDSLAVCSKAEIAAVYAAISVPKTPDVRRAEDELRGIPDLRKDRSHG